MSSLTVLSRRCLVPALLFITLLFGLKAAGPNPSPPSATPAGDASAAVTGAASLSVPLASQPGTLRSTILAEDREYAGGFPPLPWRWWQQTAAPTNHSTYIGFRVVRAPN